MNTAIALSSAEAERSEEVGGKAATLSILLRAGFPVPPGFCLPATVHACVKKNHYAVNSLPNIENEFDALIARSQSKVLIARSSGLFEDSEGALFPGIFRSFGGIRTYDQLREMVIACMQSSESESARVYCELRKTAVSAAGTIAVLIQEQIPARWAGVAFSGSSAAQSPNASASVLVELARGDGSSLLSGGKVDASFQVSIMDDVPSVVEQTSSPELRRSNDLEGVVVQVAQVCRRLRSFFHKPQMMEWVYATSHLWIVQSRPIPDAKERTTPDNRQVAAGLHLKQPKQILPREFEVGLKGAAMLFFASTALFSQPILFVTPNGSLNAFAEDLEGTAFGDSGMTVRYSFGDALGLPRYFATSKQDVIKHLQETWRPEWLAIIHSYMDVRRSFELFLAEDRWVLEHVPGIWESDTRLSPDVIISTPSSLRILRTKEPREAHYQSPNGRSTQHTDVEDLGKLSMWTQRLRRLLPLLRQSLEEALPLNIHFVEDAAGQWQFLNVRRTQPLSTTFLDRGHFHIVATSTDAESWDGVSPILITTTVDRGQESNIVQIATSLPRGVTQVYVAFGIMSHPAIVLREQGITTIPAYLSHDLFEFPGGQN